MDDIEIEVKIIDLPDPLTPANHDEYICKVLKSHGVPIKDTPNNNYYAVENGKVSVFHDPANWDSFKILYSSTVTR